MAQTQTSNQSGIHFALSIRWRFMNIFSYAKLINEALRTPKVSSYAVCLDVHIVRDWSRFYDKQNGWIWTPLMPENIYAKTTNRSFFYFQVTYLSTDWLEEKISSYLKLDKNRSSSTISTLNASLPQVIAANLIDRIWAWFWWNLLNPARTVVVSSRHQLRSCCLERRKCERYLCI